MAKIEFDGFIEEVLEGRSGPYGLRVSEPHRRKNEQDEWVTTARTFHRVTGAYQSGIQWASFSKGDRVTVVGRQVTDPYTNQAGEKKYPLVVKAETVTVNAGRGSGVNETSRSGSWGTWGNQGAQGGADGWGVSDAPF